MRGCEQEVRVFKRAILSFPVDRSYVLDQRTDGEEQERIRAAVAAAAIVADVCCAHRHDDDELRFSACIQLPGVRQSAAGMGRKRQIGTPVFRCRRRGDYDDEDDDDDDDDDGEEEFVLPQFCALLNGYLRRGDAGAQ